MELRKSILIGILAGLIALSLVGTGAGEVYVIDGNWEYENVDLSSSSNYGWWSSIGLDTNGNISIIHDDYDWSKLRETHWNGSSWESEYISNTNTAECGDYLRVQAAWDSNGTAHAVHAYWTTPLRQVLHTYWNGTGWETENVTSNVCEAEGVTIAVDSNGYPHIVYYDSCYDTVGGGAPRGLVYAMWNGVGWEIETIDEGSIVYGFPSIAIDSNDKPHISYTLDTATDPLWYGEKTGVLWSLSAVITDIRCSKSDIALDSNDKPHIVFSDYTNDCLGYVEKTGSSWDKTYLDCNEVFFQSITIDSYDRPHIAYIIYNASVGHNADLHYAMYDGYSWYGEKVDYTHETFWYGTDILLSGKTVHISYQNYSNPNGLKYAIYNLTWGEWEYPHGIYGNVYLLPLYSAGKDTDITCENDTFSTSTTADTTGYYIFENLDPGNYWINATLHSYFDNNALVEVVSGYNQTLLSGCDAL